MLVGIFAFALVVLSRRQDASLRAGQIARRRTGEQLTRRTEATTVRRTIPGALDRIPLDDRAQVRTHGRARMQRPLRIAIDRELVQAFADDRATAGCDRSGAVDVAGRERTEQMRAGVEVLAHVPAHAAQSSTLRVVELGPRIVAAHHEIADQSCAERRVREAVAAVA